MKQRVIAMEADCMLTQRWSGPPPDPEEMLEGICGTCKTRVRLHRWEATRPPVELAVGKEPGTWNDLLYTGCPGCRARVYLMPGK